MNQAFSEVEAGEAYLRPSNFCLARYFLIKRLSGRAGSFFCVLISAKIFREV